MEGQNCHFKEQLKSATAFIYRRGLEKIDLTKDTFTINISNKIVVGPLNSQVAASNGQAQVANSTSSLISDLISMRKK